MQGMPSEKKQQFIRRIGILSKDQKFCNLSALAQGIDRLLAAETTTAQDNQTTANEKRILRTLVNWISGLYESFQLYSSARQPIPNGVAPLAQAARMINNLSVYDTRLKTWVKNKTGHTKPLDYYHQCLNSDQKTRLIELTSTQEVDTLCAQLQLHASHIKRPVFYIDKPEDLICAAPWLDEQSDHTGNLRRGPGGPLVKFINENKNKNPLIIVNYENFNADDIVRFNSLLDKNPSADGTDLPAKAMVIGLINRNKSGCYQGSDFYSRFKRVEHCPLTSEQFNEMGSFNTVDVITETSSDERASVINLYYAPDWEERLLGRWEFNGDRFTFIEGELVKAIEKGAPITIQQGFWGEPAFERFWQQLMTTGVRKGNQVFRVPNTVKLQRPAKDVYSWVDPPVIQSGLSEDKNARVLNPTCLIDFFDPYVVINSKFEKKKGWIKAADGQTLVVNVTRSLNDDTWAMLLDACKSFNVKLEIHAAPGVEFPASFHYAPTPIHAEKFSTQLALNDTLITSTDVDTTLAMLTKHSSEYVVIDVSECTAADLLVKLHAELNKETLAFTCTKSDSALTTALAADKQVILKGNFSPELLDSLAPLLQRRQQAESVSGNIILISNDIKAGAFIRNRYNHEVTKEEKLACLDYEHTITEQLQSYLEVESLSKLKARAVYLRDNPLATSSEGTWLGMYHAAPEFNDRCPKLDRGISSKKSHDFTQGRIDQVNLALRSSKYVFLTGLSGVGKTTFVEKELCDQNDALYLTESRIKNWAEDQSNKRKILFIDEANLSPRQWKEFEGLFNNPPTVLIDGKLYQLTDNHRVIFAGNPVTYGDERTLASFFQDHGSAVLFKPMPIEVIYEKILKPVFDGVQMTDNDLDLVTNRILAVYRFVCECSTTDILITPRELQMMALLTIMRKKENPSQDIGEIAQHFSYALAKNLIPDSKRSSFDQQFNPVQPIKIAEVESKKTIWQKLNAYLAYFNLPQYRPAANEAEFLITPSRQSLSQQLNDLLTLRQWRGENQTGLNSQQLSGGLGGLIIEGEPGIGKSELVIHMLIKHGYQEQKDYKNPTSKKNQFYRMPVSMDPDEKEALLIKAFKEGAVVVIDEINSSSMMERLLNDLLMGKNPNSVPGEKVEPGFMIIGTQNPVTMAGRRAASSALQRRLITTELPDYTSNEIKTILFAKGVDEIEADLMIAAYESNRRVALANNLSPAPNFRHLMQLSDDHLRSQKITGALNRSLKALKSSYIGYSKKDKIAELSEIIEKIALLDDKLGSNIEDFAIKANQTRTNRLSWFGLHNTTTFNRLKKELTKIRENDLNLDEIKPERRPQ